MNHQTSPRRKGDKRERTRAAVLEAAAALVMEKGFENTSLDAIAKSAGMTRGAIYGNFKSRDELFLALVAIRWEPIIPRVRLGSSFREQMRALAEAVIAAIPGRRKSAIGAVSFQLYALRHEDMRQKLDALNENLYQQTRSALLRFNKTSDLPMPVEQLVRVLHAMMEGILTLRFLSPEQITDDVIFAAFDAIA